MPEAQLSNPPKRRRSEQSPPQQNKTLEHVSKRQKHSHPSGSQLPPAFWDNLSKIDLTKRALKELDRRNTQAALNSRQAYLRSQRPITRRVRAQLKKSSQSLIPATEYLGRCGTGSLKNIKQTARHGGPDLSDLKGHPSLVMSSTQSSNRVPKRKSTFTPSTRPSTNTTNTTNTKNTTSTASIGTYNRNFSQNLIDGGVFPDEYEYPDGRVLPQPDNWDDINRKLAQPRPSLSPSKFSDEDFRKFKRADTHAVKEKQVTTSVIPIIAGDIKDARCVSGGIPFKNLDHLTDGTLVPGNPDIYHGARPEQLNRRVRNELNVHVIPSTQDDLPIAPNFFVQIKGPDGSAAVAKGQVRYDGALGARGMHSLQSYGQENPSHDNNAYTVSSTYHNGTLKMYTSHSIQPTSSGGRPEYHMHQMRSFAMTDSAETFRQGATFYRNGMDWAKEQRDEAIRQANERLDERRPETLATESSLIPVSSFTSETTSEGTYTADAPSEESRTSLAKDAHTISQLLTPEASSGKAAENNKAMFKRSSEHAKGSRRKRRNARYYEVSQQPDPHLIGSSGLS